MMFPAIREDRHEMDHQLKIYSGGSVVFLMTSIFSEPISNLEISWRIGLQILSETIHGTVNTCPKEGIAPKILL